MKPTLNERGELVTYTRTEWNGDTVILSFWYDDRVNFTVEKVR